MPSSRMEVGQVTTQVSGQAQTYEWRLGQRVFEVTRTTMPVAALAFDPRNQRIQHSLRAEGVDPVVADQATIGDALMKMEQDHINKLYWQIVEAGGILEPLIVGADGVVTEGNCRLAALRRLCDDYPDQQQFCSPPCEVLPADFDEEARLLFLGDCHVAGKQKWDAAEIAEHVYKMVTQLGKSQDFIARTLRMSKGTVGRHLDAYEMHTAYLRKYPFPGNQYRWSYFFEFQKKKALRDQRREDPEFEARFDTWLEDGKLNRGDQVRQLPELLDDPDALSLLDTAGFAAAWEHHLARVSTTNGDQLLAVIEEAIRELENLPARDMELLSIPGSPAAEALRRLNERMILVARLAQIELSEAVPS